LSWLYRAIVALRYLGYRHGFFRTYKFPVPVIIVGNITVGGTGKTPLIIWLANFLKERGYKVGAVSRGYGRNSNGIQIVTADSLPNVVGEEALMIYERTNCAVVVGEDRIAAVKKLIEISGCEIVISDDGLQHYALGRDIEIVVVDDSRNLGNGFCLPAGPLREPASRLQDVDFVIRNLDPLPPNMSTPYELNEPVTNIIDNNHNDCHNHQLQANALESAKYTMQVIPECFCQVKNPHCKLTPGAFHHMKNGKVHAFAGIGNPGRFFQQLRHLELKLHEHIFPDHYQYQFSDFAEENDGENSDFPIIMTEKDAIKCRTFALKNWWYLHINTTVNNEFANDLWHVLKTKSK